MSHHVFVTGASGFVGSALVRRIRDEGGTSVGVGRRKLNRPDYIAHDLGHGLPLRELAGQQFDAVIHAAARSSPWGSKRQFHRDNVIATRNVVDFCERQGKPKLVFISSSSVYYRPEHQLDLTERSPVADQPVNEYAATKLAAESIVENYDGEWCILRPRAVFGPGDTVLLPRIVAAAEKGKLPMLVPRGQPVVGDLIYIDNLVDYILRSVTSPDIQGVFNLTNNEPVPIWDFLASVLEELGIAPPALRISVGKAMLGATVLEFFHRCFKPSKEPAITRFGVHVFAYSKTFNVEKCLTAMGPPRVSLDEAVHRTVEALRSRAHNDV